MTNKNKYLYHSKISEKKFREFLKYFAVDLNQTQISKLTKLNKNTIGLLCLKVRTKILEYSKRDLNFEGEIELDESYFGGKRKGDKRGRGVTNKIPVFGILKRGGKVYTQIIKNASSKELKPIIKDLIQKGSTIHTDKWKAYDGLVFDGYKHQRINHSKEFANSKSHINGIENFWGWAKLRLSKFRGINRKNFVLHLKESEFRFNHRYENLYDILLKVLRD